MKIGAQMYTVRDYCKTPDSFSDTLARLSDMGFKYVQVSGTCPYEGEWLKEKLKENGLKCVITHSSLQEMTEDIESLIAKHKVFGCDFIGLGWPGNRKEKPFDQVIEELRPVIKAIKNSGLHFSYHNHSDEFFKYNGKTEMERLLEEFDKDELSFTLDTYWVQAAGADPIQWLKRLKGRVQCIHLKDIELYIDNNGRELRYAPVGSGNMNFEGILQASDEAGSQYGLIEQDDCYGKNPFECLSESLKYLRALGYND